MISDTTFLPDSDSTFQAIRESIRDYVERNHDTKKTREARFHTPGMENLVIKDMHALGWCGMRIPEALGGQGLGLPEMSLVAAELGKGLLAGAFNSTAGLALGVLLHAPSSAARDALLRSAANGDRWPALAWQEGASGALPQQPACRATLSPDANGGNYRLSGEKRFVVGAGTAQTLLVTATTEDGLGLFAVDLTAPGVSVSHQWAADGTPLSDIVLREVAVPAENRLCSGDSAGKALERAIAEAKILASAELFGLMSQLLHMTIEFTKTRVQFGRPIGSFQVLQHKLVDAYIQQQLTSAVLTKATQTIETCTPEDASLLAARVKARANHAGRSVAHECVQLHGAMAIQDECDVGLYLKRILTVCAWLGSALEQRRAFAARALTH